MPKPGTCASCRANILWIKMAKSGKPHPVDPKPFKFVVENQDGGYVAVGYQSHFASCPNADQHRKKE